MAWRAERFGKCQCNKDPVNSILFQMLNVENKSEVHSRPHTCASARGCPCEDSRRVSLKTPEVTCKKASEVLLKTVSFIRNVPSFYQLPQEDQVLLVQKYWAPLFVMGLAQERVDFELQEQSVPSLLKKILLNQSSSSGDASPRSDTGVPMIDIQRIQMCLCKFWNLDICTKEYAYLKGIVLFNPEIHGMRYPQYVQTLQMEAWRTLMEFTSMMHSRNQVRLRCMLEALEIVKRVEPKVITELFFRPFSGEINLEDLLLETLHIK